MLHLDNEFTLEEAEILNSEVTDEIYECLLEAKKQMDRDNREQDELQAKVCEIEEEIQAYLRGERVDPEEDLDWMIELQSQIAEYFSEIERITSMRDKANATYRYWLSRYRNGIRHLEQYKSNNNGYISGYRYWDLWNMVKDKWAESKAHAEKTNEMARERLPWLWECVKEHPAFLESQEIGKKNKRLWALYFNLKDGVEQEGFDPRAHKKDCPTVDNRMLTSDEAYFESYMEDNQ